MIKLIIKNSITHAYKRIQSFANKHPIETNILFFIFGIVLSAATFWDIVSKFLSLEVQLWQIIIGIFFISFVVFIFRQKSLTNILKNKYTGVFFISIVIVISLGYLLTRPSSKRLVIRESNLSFPITLDGKSEFLARQVIYKLFNDLYKINLEFPFYFKEDVKAEINSIMNSQIEYLESFIDSIGKHPYLQIELIIDNLMKLPTEIYKITGELRFGKETDFLGGKIRHIEGRNIVTKDYLKGSEKFIVEFDIHEGKKLFPIATASEQITISWHCDTSITKNKWFRNALIFELRGQEFMEYFNEDYQRILSRMFETTIEKKYSDKFHKELTWEDFQLVALQADIKIFHTYGVSDYRKTFAIGTVENVKIGDILIPRGY